MPSPIKPLPLRDFDFTKTGSGPPLVFIHGWPFHKETYRKIIPLMSSQFTCYNLNSLGMSHGGKYCDPAVIDFSDHAKRIIQFADAAELKEFHIIGHDTGGTFARIAAANNPERIKKLILLNTEIPFHRPPFIPQYQRTFRLPGSRSVFKTLLQLKSYRSSARGYGGCFYDKSLIEGDFKTVFIDYFVTDNQKFEGMRQYLLGLNFNVIDTLNKVHDDIKAPVRFIWGKEDATFPMELGKKMAHSMKTCESFIEIAGACFLPHEEKPIEVARHALSFLKEE